jgi:hypothetical protein
MTLSRMEYDAMMERGLAWESLEALVRIHGEIVITRADGGWRIAEHPSEVFSHEDGDRSPLHEVVLDAHFRK